MRRVEQQVLLVLFGCSEQAEQHLLRRLDRMDVVVLPVQHQHGGGHTRGEVERVDLGLTTEQLRLALGEMESAVGVRHPNVAAILELHRDKLWRSGQKGEAAEAGRRALEIRSSFAGQTGNRKISVDWRDLR